MGENLMKRFNLFKTKAEEEPFKIIETINSEEIDIDSDMRVEVTTLTGQLLFVAKLQNLNGDKAELHQYSETVISQDSKFILVRIRGYNDDEKKAVYMEGTIMPKEKYVWQVKDLIVTKIGNDRAFFRLKTDIEATATMFSGLQMGEKPCRLLNISVGGACISSQFVYHKDDKFLLKVKLLEDKPASVMYCQVLRVIERSETRYEYGCRFVELNEEDQESIVQNIFEAQRQKLERS